MNDITLSNKDPESTEGIETTIIFPRTISPGWWIQETRLIFNSALIWAFTAKKADWWELKGHNGNDFSQLVWDESITGIKSVIVNGTELVEPGFKDILDAILEDTSSRIWTVIIHDDEY